MNTLLTASFKVFLQLVSCHDLPCQYANVSRQGKHTQVIFLLTSARQMYTTQLQHKCAVCVLGSPQNP
jgi:hypothetical protein